MNNNMRQLSMSKYSEIIDQIGIKQRKKLIEILEKYNFMKDIDYIIQKEKQDKSYKPKTEIYLNTETYRYLLLMADTLEGHEYRKSCINISNYETVFQKEEIKEELVEEIIEKRKSKYNKETYKKYYERNKDKILQKKRKQYKQL
jgi:hypothetical protein